MLPADLVSLYHRRYLQKERHRRGPIPFLLLKSMAPFLRKAPMGLQKNLGPLVGPLVLKNQDTSRERILPGERKEGALP